MSDELLVERAQNGCQESFSILYDRYLPYVRRTIYSILKCMDDVEDIAQEVFMAVHVQLPRFRGDSQFSTWLTTITRGKTYSYLRSVIAHKPEAPMEFDVPCSTAMNQEHEFCNQEQQQLLRKFIDELPEHLSEVALLRIEEHTMAQIAEKLKVTENAVKIRHGRLTSLLTQKWHNYQTEYEKN